MGGRGRRPSESLNGFLGERIRQGSNLDLQAQAIHRKAPWDKRTKDCAELPHYRSFTDNFSSAPALALCPECQGSPLAMASVGSKGASLLWMCVRVCVHVCLHWPASAYQVSTA